MLVQGIGVTQKQDAVDIPALEQFKILERNSFPTLNYWRLKLSSIGPATTFY